VDSSFSPGYEFEQIPLAGTLRSAALRIGFTRIGFTRVGFAQGLILTWHQAGMARR
jgi:hypothetical protein